MSSDPTVSMVIPTRNRPDHLEALLHATSRQTHPPDEVIVIDASDEPELTTAMIDRFPALSVSVEPHAPSVCAQRNRGIALATGEWILLCDDDVRPPVDYIQRLLEHAARHPGRGAITGLVQQPGAKRGTEGLPVPTARAVLRAFIEQGGLWADVESMPGHACLVPLRAWYRRRGNTWTLAGWPLMTQVEDGVIRTHIYHLGASLVRRDWLLSSPYEERLDARGRGDHYGVALGFPGDLPITVLTDLPIRHLQAQSAGRNALESYCLGAFALQSFMRSSPRFSRWNEAWLVWSLVFRALVTAVRGGFRRALVYAKVGAAIAMGRNRLLRRPAHRLHAHD